MRCGETARKVFLSAIPRMGVAVGNWWVAGGLLPPTPLPWAPQQDAQEAGGCGSRGTDMSYEGQPLMAQTPAWVVMR